MLFKNINITDSLDIELRNEDGLPQLNINSDILSIIIGTHEVSSSIFYGSVYVPKGTIIVYLDNDDQRYNLFQRYEN